MNKIIRIVVSMFRMGLVASIPDNEKDFFMADCEYANFRRLLLFIPVLAFSVILIPIAVNFYYVASGIWRMEPAGLVTVILDFCFIVVLIILWILLKMGRPESAADITFRHWLMNRIGLAVLLLYSVGSTVVDQQLSGGLTYYYLGVLSISVLALLGFKESLFEFFSAGLLLLLLLPFGQESARIQIAHFSGVFLMTAIAWAASRFMYVQRAHEFINQRTIERQKAEIERSNRELAAANIAMSHMDELKTTLVTVAADELKTPLISIRGFAQILKEGIAEDHPSYKPADRIQTLSDRMLQTISRLLERAMGIASTPVREFGPVDISEVAVSVLFVRFPQAAERGQTIKHELEERCIILGDKARINEIVDDLVFNAMTSSPKGSAVYLRIAHDPQRQKVRLTVRDAGPGMPPERLSRIFERGQTFMLQGQGDRSANVGLWLVKQYTEILRGTIRCESEPGRGTNFIVEFPAHIPDQQPA